MTNGRLSVILNKYWHNGIREDKEKGRVIL